MNRDVSQPAETPSVQVIQQRRVRQRRTGSAGSLPQRGAPARSSSPGGGMATARSRSAPRNRVEHLVFFSL